MRPTLNYAQFNAGLTFRRICRIAVCGTRSIGYNAPTGGTLSSALSVRRGTCIAASGARVVREFLYDLARANGRILS